MEGHTYFSQASMACMSVPCEDCFGFFRIHACSCAGKCPPGLCAAPSPEILWEGLGESGVFGVLVMDAMIHAAKGHERLCG